VPRKTCHSSAAGRRSRATMPAILGRPARAEQT